MTEKKTEDARERYWNEQYVAYWKNRVAEANSGAAGQSSVVAGDAKTTTDRTYLEAISLLQIGASDSVLELGCGFGRSLPTLAQAARSVAAVDISEEMIKVARSECRDSNISFHVAPAETLPFPGGSFDVVVCFASFDAMYQALALVEINRICRLSARVLLTGKSDNYLDDDEAALAAEAGARAKGHPNYFTDLRTLTTRIGDFGFGITAQKYFVRRGDFSLGRALSQLPARSYEYLLVLEKVGEANVGEDVVVSHDMSATFRRLRAG